MRKAFVPLIFLAALACVPLGAFAAAGNFFGPIIPQTGVCSCPPGATIAPNSPVAPDWGCVLVVAQNVFNLLVSLGVLLIVFAIVRVGWVFLTSGDNPANRTKARQMILNTVMGLVLILGAWLIVDFVMKQVYNPSAGFGPWNAILAPGDETKYCITAQETTGFTLADFAVIVGGGVPGTPGVTALSSASVANRAAAARTFQSQVCSAAAANGIAGQCNQLLGILAQESSGNPSARSSAGALGLMQLMPQTAASLGISACQGSSNTSPSGACVAALKDPQTNINAGVKYYAQLYNHFGGDVTSATAAYNAGPGAGRSTNGKIQAFAPSQTCPGQLVWQCTANPGYLETRNYIVNVSAIAGQIAST